jgi:hypothetical protein
LVDSPLLVTFDDSMVRRPDASIDQTCCRVRVTPL